MDLDEHSLDGKRQLFSMYLSPLCAKTLGYFQHPAQVGGIDDEINISGWPKNSVVDTIECDSLIDEDPQSLTVQLLEQSADDRPSE
jgi:hypothetical protein